MFTYGSLRRYITFRIRNRRSNRTCFLHISRYLEPYSPLWASIESRNGFDCVRLFDRLDIYIRHYPDNSNRSNWMSNSGLYNMTDQQKDSTFVIYSIHHTRQISYSWNTIHFQDALVVKWQTRETQNLVLKSVEVRVLFKA